MYQIGLELLCNKQSMGRGNRVRENSNIASKQGYALITSCLAVVSQHSENRISI